MAPNEEYSKPVPIPSAFDLGLSSDRRGAVAGVYSLTLRGDSVVLDTLGDGFASVPRSVLPSPSDVTAKTPPHGKDGPGCDPDTEEPQPRCTAEVRHHAPVVME